MYVRGKGCGQGANAQPVSNHSFPEEEYRTKGVLDFRQKALDMLKKGVLKGELSDPETISPFLLASLPFLSLSPGFVRHLYIRG